MSSGFSFCFRQIAILSVSLALMGGAATAGTISVRWDPVSHAELVGYRVYSGSISGNYSQSVDVGTNPQATLSGLADCSTRYVAVKARGADDALSEDYSNEISGWPRPAVSVVTPQTAEIGASVSLTISGANFQSGAELLFADPAIVVQSVTVVNCHQLVANLAIGGAADPGGTSFDVVNQDQVFGTGAGLLQLVEGGDEDGPVISQLEAAVVGSTMATLTWSTDEPADSQVFYRRQGQSSYMHSDLDTDLYVDHAVALHGLRPDTGYEFYVRSRDAAGNMTTSVGASFTTLANGFSYIYFEAEAAQANDPIQTGTGSSAFGGAWLELAAGTPTGYHYSPAGTTDLGFNVDEAGSYYFWYRLYAVASNANGWLEEVDGLGFDYVYQSEFGLWRWVEGRSFTLGQGLHTLTLGGHKAEARIDRVLVTNDAGFLPAEMPDDDTVPPPRVVDLVGLAQDAAVVLNWTNPAVGDVAANVVRFRTDGIFPSTPVDGLPVQNSSASSGSSGNLAHTGLVNGATYYYSVFVIDTAENVSERRSLALTPEGPFIPLGTVGNLQRTDRLDQ